MESTLVKIIKDQTEILLKNLEVQINEAPLEVMLDNVNNSRFLFHAIHYIEGEPHRAVRVSQGAYGHPRTSQLIKHTSQVCSSSWFKL